MNVEMMAKAIDMSISTNLSLLFTTVLLITLMFTLFCLSFRGIRVYSIY